MIDFQNKKLDPRVFELINKMYNLAPFEELPRFKTKQSIDRTWECRLEIPGILPAAVANKETEIEAVNKCASIMLHILRCQNDNGVYDPNIEDSIYRDNLESYFGDIDFDSNFFYYMSVIEEPFLFMDDYPRNLFKKRMIEIEKHYKIANNDEIVKTDCLLTARFLVRKKKPKSN